MAPQHRVPLGKGGHLLAGSASSHIATLVDRRTRYLSLVKVLGNGSTQVVEPAAAGAVPANSGLVADLRSNADTAR